ncbi:MAG: DNA packaging Nu1 [Alcaligenaceae bacterium]|nr:DNA packaging Nu1 [Alcaligenaceae bacterium SAGV5]MPS50443.1 DNA packaging Nu1 [Alcaligenaceae bacterium SAGV3]MPT57896.1 DNA packaging Nu1 [Alcaligenaceae bacterium]
MTIELDKKITQAKFAQLVGITQPAVSSLLLRGVLRSNDTCGNWLLAYCGNLRDGAAGRTKTAESLDLDVQRARLAAAQAERIELDNEVKRGELAPALIMEQVLAAAGAKVAAALDALPAVLKRRLPMLTDADVDLMRRELAQARNTVSALSLEDLESDEEEEP